MPGHGFRGTGLLEQLCGSGDHCQMQFGQRDGSSRTQYEPAGQAVGVRRFGALINHQQQGRTAHLLQSCGQNMVVAGLAIQ